MMDTQKGLQAIEYSTLQGYTEAGMKIISNKDLLALNVDILFLATLENQLRKDNANNVCAKIVVEGAKQTLYAQNNV